MKRVAIIVHGHTPEPKDAFRPPEEIWHDRITTAMETADDFTDTQTTIFISGGVEHNGKPEAEHMDEYAKNNIDDYDAYDIELLTDALDTVGNVEEAETAARDMGADAIIAISSQSHAPRVLREWSRHYEGEIPVFTRPTSETHGVEEEYPFIAEPGGFKDFIAPFNQIWSIPEEDREEAAEEVRKLLQEYSE